MQAPLGVLRALKLKCQNAARAVDETFQVTKNLFEKHNVVFTVGGGLLSAGAAWAGYTARQVHQKKLEEKLQKIEEHMTNVYSLEEQQVKAFTNAAAKTGVSYKTFFATSSTALIIGYALGFRSGRRFVIRRIPKELLLAAKNQKKNGSGLARLLPGRLAESQPETSTSPLGAHLTSPALDVAAGSLQFPGTSTMAQRALKSTGEQNERASVDGIRDSGAASASEFDSQAQAEGERKSEAASDSESASTSQPHREGQSEAGSETGSRQSSQAVPSSAAVDAALGKTDIERQMDRALEPERKAAAEHSERTDKILQATIPNLNGGWDQGREETDRAFEEHVGTSADFQGPEKGRETELDDKATEEGATVSSEASREDPIVVGEKLYIEALEQEERLSESPHSDESLRK